MHFLVLNAPPTRLVWTKRPVSKPVPSCRDRRSTKLKELPMRQTLRIAALLALLTSAGEVVLAAEPGVPVQADWVSGGQNNQNTRYAAGEHTINADNVGMLKPKWTFTTAGNVSATAT